MIGLGMLDAWSILEETLKLTNEVMLHVFLLSTVQSIHSNLCESLQKFIS